MPKELTLSKSQYVKGLECPLSLWFYRAAANDNQGRSSSPSAKKSKESDASLEARRAMGDKVGELAKSYFDNGVEVTADYWDTDEAVRQTQAFIDNGAEAIFEATAINPADGTYSSIDCLRKVPGTDEWDMIEVKSSTKVKGYHFDDVTFQKHVFEGAGYKIRNCYLMHINRDYVREGDIDPQGLFKLQNINRGIGNRQADLKPNLDRLLTVIESPEPPTNVTEKKCSARSCDEKETCWGEVPLYSVFNVYRGKEALEVAQETGSYDVADIPEDLKPDYAPKRAELDAHLSGQDHVDQQGLNEFLDEVEYPVYYLDYETVSSAIPLYEGTSPYQQVPFQFSLHVQEEPGGALTHVEYLHKSTDDPRRAFAVALVDACGDKGSVIVYYQDFEEGRNKELAAEFPDLADAINAISGRMVDILEPFKQRYLYSPSQNGSVSLKATLPAFTDISYDDMAIGNGEQALQEYMAFVTGFTDDPDELAALWEGLDEYCEQDTYAMVELLEVLYEKAGRNPQQDASPSLPGRQP